MHDEVVGNSASHATSSLAPPQGEVQKPKRPREAQNATVPTTPPKRPRISRVNAYLGHGGTQVCLAGLGEGADFGTFPRHWKAGDILGPSGWIQILKCPEEHERPKAGVHYTQILPPWRRRKAVVFHRTYPKLESLIAVKEDRIGWLTEYISVLATEATIPYEEPKEYSDDDNIKNP